METKQSSLKTVNFIINNNVQFSLELDEGTYNDTIQSNKNVYNYICSLQKHGFLHLESEILNIQMSVDNVHFKEVWTNNLVVEEDSDEENEGKSSTWGDCETKLLLDKYETYLPNVGPLKRFKKKKVMWEQISEDIQGLVGVQKSAIQCENRFKTIMKRKKTSTAKNKRTGENPEHIEYEDEINKICSIDDSIEPEVRLGVGKVEVNQNLKDQQSSKCSDDGPKKKKRKSVHETLWEIQRFKEDMRQKRHEEKMQLLKELGGQLCSKKEM